jgi:parallel beta-helix repeat protein
MTVLLAATIHAGAATLVVDNRAKNAADTNPGTAEAPFFTINAAAQVAQPGDTVLVREGTYRERISPARGGTETDPVVYQALPGERVEVKGSEEWTAPWTPDSENPGIFSSPIPLDYFSEIPNPYTIGISIAGSDRRIVARPVKEDALEKPWTRTLGQIFVQDEPLTQVTSLELMRQMEGSWIVSADGTVLHIHLPGNKSPEILLPTIEWSVRNRIFAPHRRGLAYIHVKGFTFLHCANQGPFPQGGAVSPRTGKNWLFEDNTIRFAKTVGLDIGSETWGTKELDDTVEEDRRLMVQAGHIVRNNTISDNGLCGIAGWNSPNVRIINNLFERNNRLNFSTVDANWEEWAAIKLHNSNAVIAHNTIRFNEAHGIWIDNGYNLSRITGNVLIGNLGSGIMMELGAGSCLIDNNIVAHTRSYGGFYDGNAIYAHDASGLTVVHNLLTANAGAGVLMRTITGRNYGGKIVGTSNTRIFNNIFDNNQKGDICLPFDNPRSHSNSSDWNVFTGKPSFRLNKYQDSFKWETVLEKIKQAGVELSPTEGHGEGAFRSFGLDAWRASTGWDINSTVIDKADFSVLPYRMLMRANIPEKWIELQACAVEEMTIDFAGNLMTDTATPDHKLRPGPLQNLKTGSSKIPLTPYRTEKVPALRKAAK